MGEEEEYEKKRKKTRNKNGATFKEWKKVTS
jgi:hypothetical protein